MKKFLPLLIIVTFVLSSCYKQHYTEMLNVSDPPEKADFNSTFRDTARSIMRGTSHGSDFARSIIKDTAFGGMEYLKIVFREQAGRGPYEKVEILINHSQLSAGLKGKYPINFDGSTTEPATLRHTYNTDDPVYPVTLYSSRDLKGEGYIEIKDYNKERKLVTGTFHSYAGEVPDPNYGLVAGIWHWDSTLDGEFISIKIQ